MINAPAIVLTPTTVRLTEAYSQRTSVNGKPIGVIEPSTIVIPRRRMVIDWNGAPVDVYLAADVDHNGRVDVGDYLAFVAMFAEACPDADLDGDGRVTAADFRTFLDVYSGGGA